MASSTTKPTAMVSAMSERLSRLKFIRYIAANEPESASGTVTLGMSVAQKFRRNSKITITTRQIVSTRVNSTSATDARMVVVRSRMVSTLTAGGMRAVRWRYFGLNSIDSFDDVGARLLEHREDDAILVVLISGDGAIDLVRQLPARYRAP